MKRTKYAVSLPGGHTARVSDYQTAMAFARSQSKGAYTEVVAPDGIIAQFRDRQPTPEFEHLGAAAVPSGQWKESMLADITDTLDNHLTDGAALVTRTTLAGWRDDLAAAIAIED